MSKLSKVLMVFFALVVLAVVLMIAWQPAPTPPSPLPVPNGYTNLIQAARQLTGEAPKANETSREIYVSYLTTKQPTLALARLGLTQTCRVPVENTMSY